MMSQALKVGHTFEREFGTHGNARIQRDGPSHNALHALLQYQSHRLKTFFFKKSVFVKLLYYF